MDRNETGPSEGNDRLGRAEMFIHAKIGAPKPGFAELELPALNQMLGNAVSSFVAPEGYLLTDSLASVFLEHDITSCWIRLGLEDCDPGTLLLSLINAVKRLLPTAGEATYVKMRRQPGPISGWGPLFDHLAVELSNLLPQGTFLVLEGIDCLNYSPICLHLLVTNFLNHLEILLHIVIISNQPLPWAVLPAGTVTYNTNDLQLDQPSAVQMLKRLDNSLSSKAINRTLELSEGRAAALASLLNASILLGPSIVDHEVRRAGNFQDLLIRVAHASLAVADEKSLQSLALAMQVEYCHPAMTQFLQPAGPWLQPLEGEWNRLRNLWNQPLQKILKVRVFSDSSLVEQAANFLENDRAFYQAVNLYFDQRKPAQAAKIIEKMAEEMMDLGQWATLNAWLKRLPANNLEERPWLIYIQGKILAAQGNIEAAHRAFALSSQHFSHQEEKRGACLSMLSESASAARQGDAVFSKERAMSAFVLAQLSGLKIYEIWSAWRLGGLAIQANDLNEALAWFIMAADASEKAGYAPLEKLLHMAGDLIEQERQLERQKTHHQQAFLQSEQAEEEVLTRLRDLLEMPPENLDEILDAFGWTNTPLIPVSPASIHKMPDSKENIGLSGLLTLLTQAFGRQKQDRQDGIDAAGTEMEARESHNPIGTASKSGLPESLSEDAPFSSANPEIIFPRALAGDRQPDNHLETKSGFAKTQPELHDSRPDQDCLKVILLGPFCVTMNGRILDHWAHNKGRAIFKYLVVHRSQLSSREMLMDTFWPDATPESARNNLNVALHNLRQTLTISGEAPLIQFQDGGYRLSPDLKVWLDIEEFEERVHEGRKLETSGLNTAALQEYEKAIALYKGDFLEDDPYNEWAVLTREHLRVAFLDTLDRSSQMYFSLSDYDACISLCQIILSYDSCREDAHCRLMRCYSRLDQVYLALRQYQECVDLLKAELNVSPADTTTSLYNKIRQREKV
ncbi:MAG: BTAD domain-containing putative transcriptional regulator [Anaerolineaceae bacterium]|nr:BTAD domain-containing putative transcriptional regulator [Anaerolineaceae bacterium]